MKLYPRRPRNKWKQSTLQIDLTRAGIFSFVKEPQISVDETTETSKQISEDGAKLREFLRKALSDSYRDEYKEFIDTIRGIETKAQGAIAIAGIFIAGAFVFLRESSAQLVLAEKILLGFSIGFFVVSVFLAVRVLRIGEADLPPSGSSVDEVFIYCLSIEQESELLEEMPVLLTHQKNCWVKVKKENTEIINLKAYFLLAGQDFLQMGIVLIAILVMYRIFGP